MEDSNHSWRSQVSFVASICLHAGAIALIALGPTVADDFHGNNGTNKVELTVTDAPKVDVAPAPAPTTPAPVAPAPVAVAPPTPAPVAKPTPVKPVVKKVAVHKKAAPVITSKTIEPQPVIEAQNNESPVETKVEEQKPEVQPEVKTEETEPVAAAAVSPVQHEESTQELAKEDVAPAPVAAKEEPVAAPAQAAAPPDPAATAATTEEKVAATNTSSAGTPNANAVAPTPEGVTQNYLGLRQQPGNKPPVYTRQMRMQQMQGAGQLVYMVNKDGTVSDLKITKSTGTPELDQAAIDAFSKYKFVPGQEGYTVHNFEFNLKGPAVTDTGRLRTTMNR